jgi:hypothetical protein
MDYTVKRMDKVRFEAELIDGHKGVTVVLVVPRWWPSSCAICWAAMH